MYFKWDLSTEPTELGNSRNESEKLYFLFHYRLPSVVEVECGMLHLLTVLDTSQLCSFPLYRMTQGRGDMAVVQTSRNYAQFLYQSARCEMRLLGSRL